MIVAFEGIDGAGKSTAGPLVVAKLVEWGYAAKFAAKRAPGVSDPFAQEQLSAISERLWGIPHDARLDSLGTAHWIYLNAAFFAGTHSAFSTQADSDQIVVFDNWINKFVTRILNTSSYQIEDISAVLRYVPQPDMVILLDVAPALAAQRKVDASELERGVLRNGRLDFVGYQSLIRASLLSLASLHEWSVIVVGDASPSEVAIDAANIVRARIDANNNQRT